MIKNVFSVSEKMQILREWSTRDKRNSFCHTLTQTKRVVFRKWRKGSSHKSLLLLTSSFFTRSDIIFSHLFQRQNQKKFFLSNIRLNSWTVSCFKDKLPSHFNSTPILKKKVVVRISLLNPVTTRHQVTSSSSPPPLPTTSPATVPPLSPVGCYTSLAPAAVVSSVLIPPPRDIMGQEGR